jgi:hypothetical protein
VRGGGPAGILRLPAARPDRERRPSCRIIRAAETPTETTGKTGKKQGGAPGPPFPCFTRERCPSCPNPRRSTPCCRAIPRPRGIAGPKATGGSQTIPPDAFPAEFPTSSAPFFAIIRPFWVRSHRPRLSGLYSTRGKKPPPAALGRRFARDRSGYGKRDRSGG